MKVRTILTERFASVRSRISAAAHRAGRDPSSVTLVAVTKSVPVDVAAIASEFVSDLAESRPQELWKKAAAMPATNWHLIGHLQRNKIERTAPLATLIHSVDSERLIDTLAAFGVSTGESVAVLLEANCSREAAKGGFSLDSLTALGDKLASLTGVSVRGLMTMAAYSDNPETARPTFAELRRLRDELRTRTGLELPDLSMGMSGDFEVAIEEGATLVRIGTTLFEGLG